MEYRCLCGHLLALPNGALADTERKESVRIWCIKCGRLNAITGRHTCVTLQKTNKNIVKQYERWR